MEQQVAEPALQEQVRVRWVPVQAPAEPVQPEQQELAEREMPEEPALPELLVQQVLPEHPARS